MSNKNKLSKSESGSSMNKNKAYTKKSYKRIAEFQKSQFHMSNWDKFMNKFSNNFKYTKRNGTKCFANSRIIIKS